MAIIKELELDNGIKLESAYFKISNINCTKEFMDFTVNIYKDKACRFENKSTIDSLNYICVHDISNNSLNVFRQAYEYLKSLDDYKNSIDDFEY